MRGVINRNALRTIATDIRCNILHELPTATTRWYRTGADQLGVGGFDLQVPPFFVHRVHPQDAKKNRSHMELMFHWHLHRCKHFLGKTKLFFSVQTNVSWRETTSRNQGSELSGATMIPQMIGCGSGSEL